MKYKLKKTIKCPRCKNGGIFWTKTNNQFNGIYFEVNWYECPKCKNKFSGEKEIIKKLRGVCIS